jgi:membrane protein YqaA with SNARE-associated domain
VTTGRSGRTFTESRGKRREIAAVRRLLDAAIDDHPRRRRARDRAPPARRAVSPSELVATLGLYGGTFAVAAVSSVIPIIAIEVFLVGAVLALSPAIAPLPALVLLAAAGQLAGKLPIYYATRGLAGMSSRHPGASARASAIPRIERMRAWVARRRSPTLVLGASAVLGLPPFSIIATAAGALGIGARTFSAVVFAGRALRFAVIAATTALAS